MARLALDRQLEVARLHRAGDDPDLGALRLQHRPLLDVRLDPAGPVRAGPAAPRPTWPLSASASATVVPASSRSTAPPPASCRPHGRGCPSWRARSGCPPRWSRPRVRAGRQRHAVQRPHHLQPGQHAEHAVEPAAGRHRVQVAAEGHGRARPACRAGAGTGCRCRRGAASGRAARTSAAAAPAPRRRRRTARGGCCRPPASAPMPPCPCGPAKAALSIVRAASSQVPGHEACGGQGYAQDCWHAKPLRVWHANPSVRRPGRILDPAHRQRPRAARVEVAARRRVGGGRDLADHARQHAAPARVGDRRGIAQHPRVGVARRARTPRATGPCSTMRPRYITATRRAEPAHHRQVVADEHEGQAAPRLQRPAAAAAPAPAPRRPAPRPARPRRSAPARSASARAMPMRWRWPPLNSCG